MKIAVFEPYYGGSHKSFINDLQSNLPFDYELFTLPARKWKWRMRVAAPYFASLIESCSISLNGVDLILCSPFLDVAVFKGLLPKRYLNIPIYTYFHENQFAYPVQVNDERDFHFSLTNLTTALASDKIAFNSQYNLDTFLSGCRELMRKSPDMKCDGFVDLIQNKSTILYPGLDFKEIDSRQNVKNNEEPVIVWNHRWEHDKNPELFFNTLIKFKKKGIAFRLMILGESFRRRPAIFETARDVLNDRIIHYGYVESREEYLDLLCESDLVVSTSTHEFYGISVIEAVRAGCCPLLPDRLSYRELFPAEYRYSDDEFVSKFIDCLNNFRLDTERAKEMTDKFSWDTLKPDYIKWLNTVEE